MNLKDCIPSIKLTRGKGNRYVGGCWMVAVSLYETGRWDDHPSCVCPIIRGLCILINDGLSSDKVRGEVIGHRLFDPIGTNGSTADMFTRKQMVIKAAREQINPNNLTINNFEDAMYFFGDKVDSRPYSRDAYIIDTLIPLLDQLVAVGNKTPIEPSYDEVMMLKALQLEPQGANV